jgi:hypothetical protein
MLKENDETGEMEREFGFILPEDFRRVGIISYYTVNHILESFNPRTKIICILDSYTPLYTNVGGMRFTMNHKGAILRDTGLHSQNKYKGSADTIMLFGSTDTLEGDHSKPFHDSENKEDIQKQLRCTGQLTKGINYALKQTNYVLSLLQILHAYFNNRKHIGINPVIRANVVMKHDYTLF